MNFHGLILVSCGKYMGSRDNLEYVQSELYSSCINIMGGCAVIPCGGDTKYLAEVSGGLILSGGGDVHPKYFGESVLSDNVVIDEKRDEYEFRLLSEFLKLGKPVLGICRGMQLINTYFGGSLFQDIGKQVGVSHSDAGHQVASSRGSIIYNVLGEKFYTNSYHHQSIKTLGVGLDVSAVCESDGIIEAIENRDKNIIGVQWHPERMVSGICLDVGMDMSDLFTKFLSYC